MTEESIDPTIRTIPELLAEVYVRLFGELMAAEMADFRAESTMSTPKGDIALFIAEREEVKAVLTSVLDELMVHRLGTNRNEKQPLLHPSDADHVVRIVFDGAEVNEDTAGSMAAGRAVVDGIIAERINFLGAIDSNLYFAFDAFVEAVARLTMSSGHFYNPVVQRIEARNAIYHSCMRPISWRKRTMASVAFIKGLSLDTLNEGGGIDGMEPELVAIVDAVMIMASNAAKNLLNGTAERLERYYDRRQEEIWRTGSRG